MEITCPRCSVQASVSTYGPCESCRAELRATIAYPVFDVREPEPIEVPGLDRVQAAMTAEVVRPDMVIQPDGTMLGATGVTWCSHCGLTDDDAVCACGCTAYDEHCGCPQCLTTHFGLAA
jgi:hypothetical protein